MSEYWPILIVLSIAIETIAKRQLNKAAQPLRLKLADGGEHLLAQPDLPAMARIHISYMLNSVFSCWLTLVIGIFMVPFVALYFAVFPRRFMASMKKHEIHNAQLRLQHSEMMELHDKITMANHPLLWMVLEIEMLIFLFVAILLAAVLSGCLPNKAVHESVMSLIESLKIRVRSKLQWHHHAAHAA